MKITAARENREIICIEINFYNIDEYNLYAKVHTSKYYRSVHNLCTIIDNNNRHYILYNYMQTLT